MTLEQRITALLDEQGLDVRNVVPKSHLQDDLGADSLDVVEVCMGLEELFDVKISDDDMDPLSTLDALVKYVEENVEKSKIDEVCAQDVRLDVPSLRMGGFEALTRP